MQEWIIKISVTDQWVEDGFNLTPEVLKEIIRLKNNRNLGHEFECAILKAPDPKTINRLQENDLSDIGGEG